MPMARNAAALLGCCSHTAMGKNPLSFGKPLANTRGWGCTSGIATALGRGESIAAPAPATSRPKHQYQTRIALNPPGFFLDRLTLHPAPPAGGGTPPGLAAGCA